MLSPSKKIISNMLKIMFVAFGSCDMPLVTLKSSDY